MNISEFCIRRPVFTTLLMLSIVVFGIFGYLQLPVSSLPNVEFPTITVNATLPGASPETMASSVATTLEKQFLTIPGVSSITSSSYLGNTQITLQFDLDRDIDYAALDVQSALAAAARRLPTEMRTPPSFQKSNPANQPVIFISVSSDTLPLSEVNEYAENIIGQRISTIAGVGQVLVYGSQKYALRIQVDPEKLASMGIGLNEIAQSIEGVGSNTPMGSISGNKRLMSLNVTGQPKNAKELSDFIAVWRFNSPIFYRDIAEISDSVQDLRNSSYLGGKQGVTIAVVKQQDANTVKVVEEVKKVLPIIESQLPSSVQVGVRFDRSLPIKESMHDVQLTLMATIILVVLVIYCFILDIRSTIIPAITVPLSIIATYGAMHLFGFTLNNISLLAITLCVGLVVDDAIVMMENIRRYIEEGYSVIDASFKGSKEISFTIISISVSLVVVFIPLLLMDGLIGRLFREFAITITVAILISAFVSLTLTPLMCSRIISNSNSSDRAPNRFIATLHEWFLSGKEYYGKALTKVIIHKQIWLIVTIGMIFLSMFMFSYIPKGFVPTEDLAFVISTTEGPEDISYDAMLAEQMKAAEYIAKDKDVVNIFHALGGGRGALNSGRMFIGLKPVGERENITKVLQRLRNNLPKDLKIKVYFQPAQTLQIGGRISKSLYQYTLQSINLDNLNLAAQKIVDELSHTKGFQDVNSDIQSNALQAVIDVDKDLMIRNGLTYEDIKLGLFSAYGNQQVSSLYTQRDSYQIILEVVQEKQRDLDDIARIYLKNNVGKLVSLDSIAKIYEKQSYLTINHQSQMPSVTISFNLAEGFSLSEALEKIEEVEQKLKIGADIMTSFQGNTKVFQDSLKGQGLLILLAIVVIYIILGMLYESFIHPITILCGIPAAGIGALISLMLVGMDLNIISFIGIILLIGIVKKNSIMMIDFAIIKRNAGKSPEEAIYEACLLRFRPIMMTTMAALFGTLPIALGLGAGSELRQPLGIAVVGGLLLSQFLTLFITPVIYLYLEKYNEKLTQKLQIA